MRDDGQNVFIEESVEAIHFQYMYCQTCIKGHI